jgi:protein-S-isoprenylcysteine O-methyltransferase Ste14
VFLSLRGAHMSRLARLRAERTMEMSQVCDRPTRRRMKGSSRQAATIVFMAASLIACGSTAFAQRSLAVGLSEVGGTVVRSADEGPLHAAVRREGARLAQSSAPDPQTAHQQGPRWIVRHPVIVGTVIGTGGGAALSRVEAIGGVNHDPRVALIGTGAGAWGGLIASVVHKARAGERIGVGAKIGIVVGAVGLIVLPVLACYGAGGCGGSS